MILLGKPKGQWLFGRTVLQRILKKWDEMTWTGFIWLWIGTSGGLFWPRQWTLRFHQMRGISCLFLELLASQEGPCSFSWLFS